MRMKTLFVAAGLFAASALPSFANAGGHFGGGHYSGGNHGHSYGHSDGHSWGGYGGYHDYDDRHRSHSHFSLSLGFGGSYFSDPYYSSRSYGYYDEAPVYGYSNTYCAPPVVYAPAYVEPPVVYYSAPQAYYYDSYCSTPRYFRGDVRFHYGR